MTPADEWLGVERVNSEAGDGGGVQIIECTIHRDRLPDSSSAEFAESAIHVRTNHHDCPELAIRVYVRRDR